jgi:hypothetical protein
VRDVPDAPVVLGDDDLAVIGRALSMAIGERWPSVHFVCGSCGALLAALRPARPAALYRVARNSRGAVVIRERLTADPDVNRTWRCGTCGWRSRPVSPRAMARQYRESRPIGQ